MYEPFTSSGFGAGLNLRDKSDAVNEAEAIDALNVVFTERGAVQNRHGYDELNGSAMTNRAASLAPHYESDGTKQLLAGCGTRLEAVATAGTIVASATGLTDGIWDFTRFGGPTAEVSYAGNGKNDARKWDGSAWSSVAAIGKPRYLEVMAVDLGNRMVIGGFDSGANGPGGATVNVSRVHFSDPGAPETWTANNYVDLTPGDGEKVQGILAWREFVFVFKETKFFRFHSPSEGPDGTPVFNYTTFDTGIGLASPRALCADERGVYFLHTDGVYMTAGGEPRRVSTQLDPLFIGGTSDYFLGGELLHSQITNSAMGVHEDRVYLGYTSTGTANDYTLVYDPTYQWWTLWNTPAAAFTSFKISSQAELVFAGSTGDNDIYRVNSTLTSDNGTAITTRWRSGWFDYEAPEVKTIRESKVWGLGKVDMAISADYAIGTGTPVALDFTTAATPKWQAGNWQNSTWADGTANRLEARLRRHTTKGAVFSVSFSSARLDQNWAVHRLTHNLRDIRIPSVRKGSVS
jgi:hypothetical protein